MGHKLANSPLKTVAIILARGGSKGVPGKNLRKVGGVSLVGRSVRAARSATLVDAVFVSTDDAAIAAEALSHGAEVIERPAALSDDTASSEAGWLHALDVIAADAPQLSELVFLQCTSPFTTGQDIDGCLAAMRAQKAACALSVIEDHSFLWGLDENGFAIGLNHAEQEQRKRRQDLPPQYCENGAIYAVQVGAFRTVGRRFCGAVALHVVDHPPVEIDSLADLTLCAQIAATRTSISPERLKAVKALVMDFDGVHTDNLVITDENGVEAVRTSRGDGMGLSLLRAEGRIRLMILSKERNPVVLRRAEKLGIDVFHAVDDKVAALDKWLSKQGLDWNELLYVGNDVNDSAAMARAGISACPSDAHSTVLQAADWVLPEQGGRGALRHICDAILEGGK